MPVASRPGALDGDSSLSRRDFVKVIGAIPFVVPVPPLAPEETAVARFFKALRGELRTAVCFPSDHPLRFQVSNHWAIAAPRIRDLSPVQQALCKEIFTDLCSEEGHGRFLKQMKEDDGGFENYHVAVFGEPGGSRPFEWVLTGRHATLRADGNRTRGASCDGPIFYGHASGTANVWSDQAEQAAAIFKSLDSKLQARVLHSKPNRPRGTEAGLAVRDLDGERKAMVRSLLKTLLSPFRSLGTEGLRECLRDAKTADLLRLTYFDGGDGRIANVWKLEGPAFSWYYHGTPHVHAWLNVAG